MHRTLATQDKTRDVKSSSMFQSTSQQRLRPQRLDNPGVGSYELDEPIGDRSGKASAAFKNTDRRFRDEAQATETAVGPGAYSVEAYNAIESNMSKKGERGAAFSSSVPSYSTRPHRSLMASSRLRAPLGP